MQVPFFDWKRLYLERRDRYLDIVDRTASRGGFILQEDVRKFEESLERFLGVRHAIAVSDATNAMLLGLRAMNIEQGDEVILPSHSFIAAAQSIHFAGGVPVPCELERDGMADVADMERRITPKTRALMPVHVNGRMADVDAIGDIAGRHNLDVVEDSAQALGAKFKDRAAGTVGRWGCFSFYPSKTLGTFGDAGALVTNDDALAEKVRRMRNHGANAEKSLERENAVWGTNCRLDNIHAAILNYKMTWYSETVARRRAIAMRYHEAFKDVEGLALPPPPEAEPDRFDVFQNYELESDRRDELRAYLADRGVGTIIQWGGLALHEMRGLGFSLSLPKTERFFKRCLLLPMNHMLNDQEVGYIVESVRAFHRAGSRAEVERRVTAR
jgi:dTDP-4-amino-4,6-dideoxygalactose transaminase